MSDQTPPPEDQSHDEGDRQPRDEQEWPEHCPQCGTRLQQVAVDFTSGSSEEVGATADVAGAVFEDRCPNPDCPAHRAAAGDAAGTSHGSSGSLGDRQPDQPTTPGSLGGDNGGA